MRALRKLVSTYEHPCGLFAAMVESCEKKPKVLARYLSPRAVAQQKAIDAGGTILSENGKVTATRHENDKEIREEFGWDEFEEQWEDLEDIYHQKGVKL